MFGNNNKDFLTREQLEDALRPLTERVDKLETNVKKQAERASALEQELQLLRDKIKNEESPPAIPSDGGEMLNAYPDDAEPTSVLDNAQASGQVATTYFLPAPTPDGVFLYACNTEEVGKSIYQLTTTDGINGQFIFLSTPDAIATATISVSQFVKPVCRIEGNVNRLPMSIVTLEEGMAVREGNSWRTVKKAKVQFG